MLRVLRQSEVGVRPVAAQTIVDGEWTMPADAVWIDLASPSRQEELAMEAALGVNLPTRDEMAEIEVSSRLYQEHGATFMIATLLTNTEEDEPRAVPVTFVLVGGRLVTIRYDEPRAFAAFMAQVERQPNPESSGVHVFLGLLDAIIDRISDVLEHASEEVEQIARAIFHPRRKGNLESILHRLGRANMVMAKGRESLVTLARVTSFAALADEIETDRECKDHLTSLRSDVTSLTDHVAYQSGNITFLLDAALGFIGIEQNSLSKIFSVASVVFLPATLLAGVYGMNFEHMPELREPWAYPAVLVAMVVVMVVPVLWMRRRGWL
jgi:magnesium transporter